MNKQQFLTTLFSSIVLMAVLLYLFSQNFSTLWGGVIVFTSVVVGQTMGKALFNRFSNQTVSNKTVFATYTSILFIGWLIASILF